MLKILSSKAKGSKDFWKTPLPKQRDAKIFENQFNPVKLVFIGKLSLSTLRWVPMCQGLSIFPGFLHHFVLAKLATSNIRVKLKCINQKWWGFATPIVDKTLQQGTN